MDFFDVIREISEAFPHIDESEIRAAMDIEVPWEESRLKGRDKYRRAVKTSGDRIVMWLRTGAGDFQKLDTQSLESMARFVSGRCASCTWAILRSLQMKHSGPCECRNCATCGGFHTICGRCLMCTVCHEHARGCPTCTGFPPDAATMELERGMARDLRAMKAADQEAVTQ